MASIFKAVKLNSAIFGKSKHKKLPEEWGDNVKEPVVDGITFYVKYIGSTLVEEPNRHKRTAESIKAIISMAKASGRKLTRVAMTVTPKGILTTDIASGEPHLELSIYRISFCSVDATFDRVVALIGTNKNETLECHAFLCSKRKVAQATALTISQAFNIAFDLWEQAQEEKKARTQHLNMDGAKSDGTTSTDESSPEHESPPLLIDLSSPTRELATETIRKLGFDSDENLNDSFSRLAMSRTSHPMFETSWNAQEVAELEQFVTQNPNDNSRFLQEDDSLLLNL